MTAAGDLCAGTFHRLQATGRSTSDSRSASRPDADADSDADDDEDSDTDDDEVDDTTSADEMTQERDAVSNMVLRVDN